MRNKVYLSLIFCLLSIWVVFPKGNSNDAILNKLDKVIENKKEYSLKKEYNIKSIKLKLRQTSDPAKVDKLYDDLFNEYLHFQADSAMKYINRREVYSKETNDASHANEISISKAEVMGVMGMYNDALLQLKKVDKSELDKSLLNYFYRTSRAYYGWLADYTPEAHEKDIYSKKTSEYRDSIILTSLNPIDRSISFAEKYITQGKGDLALEVLKGLLNQKPTSKQKVYIYFTISEVYNDMNMQDKQIEYLAKTAILDIEDGTKEYASLQKLAYLMYDIGDLDRAYKYLSCSMEDAVSCNARLRYIEVTQFFPIIDSAYKAKENKEKAFSNYLLIGISIFALFLIAALFYVYSWMKKLSVMRRSLSITNEELKKVNSQLAQTGKIKDVYIARYLNKCVSYMDQLEAYRRSLAKMAMASRIDDLFKTIKSDQFVQDERKNFYTEFDRSFLELFPNFVKSFNALLIEEARIYPKSEELLTTELRIFALIRLGVTDSNRIAHFLGYSLATIYNYRSKLRNKAVGNKDTFEQDVMNL